MHAATAASATRSQKAKYFNVIHRTNRKRSNISTNAVLERSHVKQGVSLSSVFGCVVTVRHSSGDGSRGCFFFFAERDSEWGGAWSCLFITLEESVGCSSHGSQLQLSTSMIGVYRGSGRAVIYHRHLHHQRSQWLPVPLEVAICSQ